MKKVVCTLMLLVIAIEGFAQLRTDNIDSLLAHFKVDKPFVVYDYYPDARLGLFDWKKLYYNQELKTYLLQWLNIDEYIDYRMENYKKELASSMDEVRTRGFDNYANFSINIYINKHKLKLNFDSIYADPKLYQQYKDSTIAWMIAKEQARLESQKSYMLPPGRALDFLSRIAYPEVYAKIKKWSIDLNLPFGVYPDVSPIYVDLLRMNDPDSQHQLDSIIKMLAQTNGNIEDYDIVGMVWMLKDQRNAYSIEKLMELSSVTQRASYFSDEHTPTDKEVLYILQKECKEYKIKLPTFNDLDSTQLRIHSKEILAASQELIIKKKKEEEYWMMNMPFYNKQDSLQVLP